VRGRKDKKQSHVYRFILRANTRCAVRSACRGTRAARRKAWRISSAHAARARARAVKCARAACRYGAQPRPRKHARCRGTVAKWRNVARRKVRHAVNHGAMLTQRKQVCCARRNAASEAVKGPRRMNVYLRKPVHHVHHSATQRRVSAPQRPRCADPQRAQRAALPRRCASGYADVDTQAAAPAKRRHEAALFRAAAPSVYNSRMPR